MSKPRLERLLADWPAKILSLAGAVALFFFYQLNRLEERPLSVPLTVISNDDFVPASQYPRTVRLVLRGESNAIYAVLEGDLQASLDLRGYTGAGVWRVPVRVEKRGSALGIDPLEISVDPSDIAISIEPRVIKEIQVVPSFRGYLEPGYELSGFRLMPAKVEVAGPASAMDKIEDTSTEPIELTGRNDNFTVGTKVLVRDPLVSLLSSSDLEFTAEVKKALVYRNYQDLEVLLVGLRDGLALDSAPPLGSARVAASSIELESFSPSLGSLEVDLSEIEEPGVYTVAVVPRFPAGFDVESWLPMVATVTVTKASAGVKPELLP
ncbi:MAG: CdaR family protein [Spirochaetia bacterium]|nr:CdaR family protein [Spirochaetia bacterium]